MCHATAQGTCGNLVFAGSSVAYVIGAEAPAQAPQAPGAQREVDSVVDSAVDVVVDSAVDLVVDFVVDSLWFKMKTCARAQPLGPCPAGVARTTCFHHTPPPRFHHARRPCSHHRLHDRDHDQVRHATGPTSTPCPVLRLARQRL